MMDRIEVKFDAGMVDDKLGTFEGYGAVFGNIDSYGDVIQKGAFRDTLREFKKAKRMPVMLVQHGGFMMTDMDALPIGKWEEMDEDDTGLRVKGRLINLDTERGKLIHGAMREGVLDGMSIGYRAKEFEVGTKPEQPRRLLKKIDLVEVSIVTFPANGKSRVESVKAASEDMSAGIKLLGQAIELHAGHMDGSIATTDASQAEMMDLMKKAFSAFTDSKLPGGQGMKTTRQFESFLRDAGGFSLSHAKAIASHGFKAADPWDEDCKQLATLLRARTQI